jgi:hypothetical protein
MSTNNVDYFLHLAESDPSNSEFIPHLKNEGVDNGS